jgi:coniferyl-aldehyde dehydrogenase
VNTATLSEQSESEISQLTCLFIAQREAYCRQRNPDLAVRLDRISRIVDFVVEQQDAIVEATLSDWIHKPAAFVKAVEILPIINHAKAIRKNLKKWMRDEVRKADFPFNLVGAKAYIHYQPVGVVGVMVPWNGPIAMAMVAAMDAFSAGNRVMVKISEFSPAAATMLAEKLPQYFASDELAIITGEVDVSRAFSELPFDHLMYTGSAGTAKHIMAAAAKNLTPVTLELGGKSPVIVDRDSDIEFAAQRTMSGRLINSGQGCITPDYVLIEKAMLEGFLRAAEHAVKAMYPVEKRAKDYASIATDAHYKRTRDLIDEARERCAKIVEIDIAANPEKRQINPVIVVDPFEETRVMREEIFGPVLVIKTVANLQEAVDYINAGERPLALYYFGANPDAKEFVLEQAHSGGVAVNEVMMQLMMSDLPFGGVGHSGMGSYWGGGAGFKRFSHAKSVFEQGWYKKIAGMLDPPYGQTLDKMLKMGLKKLG